jgi:hypothetical protein
MEAMRFDLIRDQKGMMWDLLLYIPTVTALLSMAAKFYFGDDINLSYLLLFLGSFFFIAGASRILKTRLMILPSAPVAIEIDKQKVGFTLRNGKRVDIVKDLRYYPAYADRSFGLAGMDISGQRMQFVFHKGQFHDESAYQAAQKALRDR